MRTPELVKGLAALVLAVALVSPSADPAHAARRDGKKKKRAGTVVVDRRLPVALASPSHERFQLGRAALERSTGNPRGVVECLETIDFTREPTFEEADRAAFLLAQAHLEMGSHQRFVDLARRVGEWRRTSVYTEWIAFQLALIETAAGDSAAAHGLTAGVERGADSPVATYLEAMALAASGADDDAALAKLSRADTVTALGRDLASAAIVRRATRALQRGQDPSVWLEAAPARSRYGSRARHMLGMIAFERGDLDRAERVLRGLLAEDSTYAARREVMLVLAALQLDRGRWQAAHQSYQRIDQDWSAHRAALVGLRDSSAFDALWAGWRSNPPVSDALTLDADPARLLAERLAAASADLTARPGERVPPLAAPAPPAGLPWAVPPPPAEEWREIAASERAVGEAAAELTRTRWALARERETLEARRGYLAGGATRTTRERTALEARVAMLDSMRAVLDKLDRQLREVGDESSRRIVARASKLIQACSRHMLWMDGMRHFHVEGPNRERPIAMPPGVPSPESLLEREAALARSIQALAERLAEELPRLIARSYQGAWRPNLIDRATQLSEEAQRALAWARAIGVSIDSSIAAARTSEAERELAARLETLAGHHDSLVAAHARRREQVARQAVERALETMGSEREAIDYGLASSGYGLSVRLMPPAPPASSGALPSVAPVPPAAAPRASEAKRLSPAEQEALTDAARWDSIAAHGFRQTRAIMAGGETRGDSATAGGLGDSSGFRDELDDPAATLWRGRTIAMLRQFLERHTASSARGEMRFRLADLLLVDARHEFRDRMASYVRAQAEGAPAGEPPVLSYAEALALYRTILEEDRDFRHRDAVLFNAGMILADEANSEAADFFERLVTLHPESPYCQEAYLRMADMRFIERRYRESVALYQRAAEGPDANLQAIALYKMGWAHFNEDRFLEAADAFCSVLDLYGSRRRREIHADVESEAHTYLVQSMAGAGGAQACVTYFDRNRTRHHERRVLMALAQHYRRMSLYHEAVAVDELSLRRYPHHPDALVSARRLTETYQRMNRPDLARKAQAEYARRYAPGGTWHQAQAVDSVQTEGAEFARSSLKSLAFHHHREARTMGSENDWQKALDVYESMLSTWPSDPERTTYRLHAGEASAHLGQYPSALEHYRAAESGGDSVARVAAWQRVAVTDAWYESTRGGREKSARSGSTAFELGGSGPSASVGRDTLARAVLVAADELIARYPEHEKAADLRWRQGNLALSHGWFDRAAEDFGALSKHHPGDRRAPLAAGLRADALFRTEDYEAAGLAYEEARATAQRAGLDSLELRAARAIPISYFKHAESAVATDSTKHARHATLFEKVATRWPDYENAHVAQYRAGLSYLKAGKERDAIRAMENLARNFPTSEYVPDAHLQIAKTWEAVGEKEQAAIAYARFAELYPKDASAKDAWLKSADLFAAAGLTARADQQRLAYIKKYPEDVEAAMEIYEALARRDLATVGASHPISKLIGTPPATAAATGKKTSRKAAATKPKVTPSSHLATYLTMASTHPKLASPSIIAQVRFLEGEEALSAYTALRLRLPLKQSIATKQKSLDDVLARYKKSVELGDSEWARASTHRIGQALMAFGEAVQGSERPADLQGDDLLAYEEILMQRSQAFYDRGEEVWSDLLREKAHQAPDDPWITKTQTLLWQRLANRFYYRPAAEFPVAEARAPAKRSEQDTPSGGAAPDADSGQARAHAKPEGDSR